MRDSTRLLLLLAIALGGCTLTSSLGGGTTTTSDPMTGSASGKQAGGGDGKIVMLDLVGMTAGEAAAAVRGAGFISTPEVNRILLECEGVTKQVGRISCQAPKPGELADRYAIISVTVEEGARPIAGALVRAQLEKVRGMTIAEAKAYLKRLGHDGEVVVWEQPTFSNSCGANKVCEASPESGTGIHDRITLVINPNSNVDISLPP